MFLKCNFPMSRTVRTLVCQSVGRLVGRLVCWSVCHYFMKGHFHAPIRPLVFIMILTYIMNNIETRFINFYVAYQIYKSRFFKINRSFGKFSEIFLSLNKNNNSSMIQSCARFPEKQVLRGPMDLPMHKILNRIPMSWHSGVKLVSEHSVSDECVSQWVKRGKKVLRI